MYYRSEVRAVFSKDRAVAELHNTGHHFCFLWCEMLGRRLLPEIEKLEASCVDFALRLKNQDSPVFLAADRVSNAVIFQLNRKRIEVMSRKTDSVELPSGERLRIGHLPQARSPELMHLLETGFSEDALAHLKLKDVNAVRLKTLLGVGPHVYFGAFVDERLVGYGTLKVFFGGQAYLVFAVEESWRRRGVACELVRFMVDTAVSNGYRVRAFVDRDNVASYRLLSKLGCQAAQVTEDHFVMEYQS